VRRSYRDGVKHQTQANLSKLPEHVVEVIEWSFRPMFDGHGQHAEVACSVSLTFPERWPADQACDALKLRASVAMRLHGHPGQ
jgi:hypothetical protein